MNPTASYQGADTGLRKIAGTKATGVSRQVDDLGRIVLPAELRRSFNIRKGDHVDISVDDDRIILAKQRILCTFCGSEEDLRSYRDHQVCNGCITELRSI